MTEKLLLTRTEAARALSISVDTLDILRAQKKIKTVTIGSRVFVAKAELEAFITKEGGLDA